MERIEMGVRVVHQQIDSPEDRDYVHVSTSVDPNDDTVTLATIKRITARLVDHESASPATHVKTLVEDQPMSPDSALGLATRYAERKHIDVVYAETQSVTKC
jgi:hypothetical protein